MTYLRLISFVALGLLASSDTVVLSKLSSIQLAQGFGSLCSTPWGTCVVPPQPVGSVCFCGGAQGFIAG